MTIDVCVCVCVFSYVFTVLRYLCSIVCPLPSARAKWAAPAKSTKCSFALRTWKP